MEIDKIVEKLKYYNEELPKETLKEAINQKENIIPKLLDMLEYTKENIEDIYNGKNDFFGYVYAIFLLAQFREKKTFPYLIYILNMDEDVIEYIMGDDYLDNISRLLASTYNGDDQALFDIIENNSLNEFIRSSALQTFCILHLHGVKDRDFIINYFSKLLQKKQDDDNSYLYAEIFNQTENLRLIELKDVISKTFNSEFVEKYEIEGLEKRFEDENYVINMDTYPFYPFYHYIDNVIDIMDKWQCFCYKEDEEFEKSYEYKMCQNVIINRKNNNINKIKIGRNEPCYCGSGKKYKKCCINKNNDENLELLELIDINVARAYWYMEKNKMNKAIDSFRCAFALVEMICIQNNIRNISDYNTEYEGYDFFDNWLQEYEVLLDESNEKPNLYERLKLCNDIEKVFDLKSDIYFKELIIRARANTQFRLGNEELATNLIEEYLLDNPSWIWGYVEMADWYNYKGDKKHYNLEKSKDILLRAEKIKDIEDIECIYERLSYIYAELGDKKMAMIYSKK